MSYIVSEHKMHTLLNALSSASTAMLNRCCVGILVCLSVVVVYHWLLQCLAILGLIPTPIRFQIPSYHPYSVQIPEYQTLAYGRVLCESHRYRSVRLHSEWGEHPLQWIYFKFVNVIYCTFCFRIITGIGDY